MQLYIFANKKKNKRKKGKLTKINLLQIEYMHCNSESPANSFATCHVYYRKSLLNFIILFNQYIDLLHIPTGISSCRFLCTVYYYDELEKKKKPS